MAFRSSRPEDPPLLADPWRPLERELRRRQRPRRRRRLRSLLSRVARLAVRLQ